MTGYDVKVVEENWKKYWEKEKIYKFDPNNKKKVYSIDMPPPTLSGNMHIGHAFSYSQQDFIVRFHRMRDGNVFYPFGSDDNGLPTERLIEKLKNVRSKEMSRDDFIKLCLKTLDEIRPDFVSDWKNIGVSCDYDLYYSTIDDNSRKISQAYFLELLKKGIAYEKEFPTIWCPECQTSIAQAELEDKNLASSFLTLRFGVGNEELLIATTRPELLGACVAVFVHPKDKRYKKIVGKKAKVPVFGNEVPIIADDSASIDKGTGAMMVCAYGDKYDVDAVNRHKLEPRVIFNKNGTLNIGSYNGLKIKEARKKIIQELREKNLIKEEKSITHVVNVHDKCGTEIEFIPTSQWFIKILNGKKTWISQAKKMVWRPEFMFKRYENWVNGLEWDWNVSRDRHFGVAIPVWKCPKCKKIIPAEEKELPVDPLNKKKICPKCKCEASPEDKVLDTWATSSLTPQIISSLVNGKIKLPLSLRAQAHEIIRTWTFYTIVRSYFHENNFPWQNVALSGFVTLRGEKMSKSKGNVISPRDVLAKHGADAIRYWAASSKLGEDMDYQEKDLVTGRKLVTKLVNASRFVFMNLEGWDGKKAQIREEIDELFLQKIDLLVNSVTKHFDNYNYSQAKLEVENFFYKIFTDNYIEIIKKRVYQGEGEKKKSAQFALYDGLFKIVQLIAPIMPFVTEEIYQTYFKKFVKEKSIHLTKWPDVKIINESKVFDLFLDVLARVRKEKTEAKKAMNSEIVLTLSKKETDDLYNMLDDLKNVTNAKEIRTGKFKVEFL